MARRSCAFSRWSRSGPAPVLSTGADIELSIQGVRLPARSVSYVFAGTPLGETAELKLRETLASAFERRETKVEDLLPDYMSSEDARSVLSFLQGDLTPEEFYTALSKNAFRALSGPGTYLDRYEYPPIRAIVNLNFVPNIPFIQELSAIASKVWPQEE